MIGPKTIDAINRVVANLLATGSDVFLPGIGSLYTIRRAAQQISRRTIRPPYRAVDYASQERGVSLVDEIARVAQCDAERAKACYDGWVNICYHNDILTINGVGVLKFKQFNVDEAFDRLLNPQGHKPIRLRSRKRFDWSVWVGIAAILVAVGFGGYEYIVPLFTSEQTASYEQEQPAETVAVVPETAPAESPEPETPVEAETTPSSSAEPEQTTPSTQPATAEAAPAATATDSAPAASADSGELPRLTRGRYYVVFGVFSTRENAERAAEAARKGQGEVRCTIYRFGQKFMLSPFDSDDAAAAARFIESRKSDYPDAWTYAAR